MYEMWIKIMGKHYWLKAGLFFALFEGIFWTKGNIIFYWFFGGYKYNRFQLLLSFICTIISVLFFGLFIKYTAKEVNSRKSQ